MLDSHPDLAVPLDVTGLWSRYQNRLGDYDLATDDGARRLIGDLLGEERIALWKTPLTVDEVARHRVLPDYPGIIDAFYRAYAARHGKKRWADKDPGNILRIHELNRWFPDSQVVHILRDGRGACVSHLDQAFGFQDVLECASAWREQVWWARRVGEILGPRRYHELRYEALVARPQAELERLCRFLGLPYAAEMLDYPNRIDQSIPLEKRHIWPLIGEPPRQDNAAKWTHRMSRGTQVCFEKRAGALLNELGYETTPPPWRGAYATELKHMLSAVFRAVRGRVGGF